MSLEFRTGLLQLIEQHFNEGELHTLCFRLLIDYEGLPGKNKHEKARELIGYCERRDLVGELLMAVNQERPSVEWPSSESVTMSSPGLITPRTDSFDTGAFQSLGASLLILAELVKTPLVRDTVIGLQKDFEAAQSKIEFVSYYKRLHDLFQEMEASYNVIKHNYKDNLADDAASWDGLKTTALVLQSDIHALIQVAEKDPYVWQAGFWLQLLRQGQSALRTALARKDLSELNRAFRFLSRALERGLTRVNSRLVDSASDLPLDDLIRAMSAVLARWQEQAGPQNENTLSRFSDDIRALKQLSGNLSELVKYHNNWQWMDDELRRIEALLGEDVEELKLVWPDLQEMSRDLYAYHADADMQAVSRHLEESLLAGRPPAVVIGHFQSYRSLASRRFRQVDDKLLTLCKDLQHIGERLDYLLGNIP